MQTFSSRDVQQKFGTVIDLAKREPITVTQYGRPVVVIMSVQEAKAVERQQAGSRLAAFLRQLPLSPQAETLTDEDINALVHELR